MGGAIPGKDFLVIMKQAGFVDAEMVSETGFNSSPVTKGALLRASKPSVAIPQQRTDAMDTLVSIRNSLRRCTPTARLIAKQNTLSPWELVICRM